MLTAKHVSTVSTELLCPIGVRELCVMPPPHIAAQHAGLSQPVNAARKAPNKAQATAISAHASNGHSMSAQVMP